MIVFCEQFDDRLLQRFIRGRKNRIAVSCCNDGVRLLDGFRIPDDAHFDFAGPRAVAELNSRNCENLVADCFFNHRLANAGDPVDSPFNWQQNLNDQVQDGQHRRHEHRLELARRPWQNKEVRRRNPRVDIRLQVKSRRASVFIWQNLRPFWNVGLTGDPRRPLDAACLKSLLERSQ